MPWCQLITQDWALYPNIKMIIEIILVIQAKSANVEWGFSTLRRNLQENGLYKQLNQSKERLNQIFTVKINLPMIVSTNN